MTFGVNSSSGSSSLRARRKEGSKAPSHWNHERCFASWYLSHASARNEIIGHGILGKGELDVRCSSWERCSLRFFALWDKEWRERERWKRIKLLMTIPSEQKMLLAMGLSCYRTLCEQEVTSTWALRESFCECVTFFAFRACTRWIIMDEQKGLLLVCLLAREVVEE